MRTLCKKALALCVVFALALTCFVGTFAVSAADPYDATITVADVAIEQGTTSVDVVLNITAAEPGINEAIISVSSDLGSIVAEPELTSFTATENGDAYVDVVGDDFSKIFLSARKAEDATDLNGVTAATIKFTFDVAADKAIGDYAINIETEGVKAADKNETVVNFVYEVANVTVVAPHVHNVVWTSDNAGNHTSSCDAEGCKDFEATTEACTDADVDNACDKCGYAFPVEPEHTCEMKAVYSVEGTSCVTKLVCEDPTCGNEQVVSTIASAGAGHTGIRIYRAPVLEAGLAIAFRVLTTATSGYTDIYGDFTKTVYADDGSDTEIEPAKDTLVGYHDDVYGDKRFTFKYEGISSKEMCSNINIKIFGTNSDGIVCFLGTLDYSLSSYVVGNYNKAGYESVSPLLADLAFYGASAQDYFNYHLSTKPIIDTHTALPTEFNTTDKATGITISKAPDLANKVIINYRFDKAAIASYGDAVTFEVDYIDGFGNPQTMVKTVSEFENYSDTRYNITFDLLESNHIVDVVTARLMNGETVLGSLEYSLEKYAYNRYTSANQGGKLGVLTQALVNYGRTAAEYFAK